MNRDQEFSIGAPHVAKGVFHFCLLAGVRVRKKIIAHRSGRIFVDDDAGVFESNGAPRLKRESFIFAHNPFYKV